MNGKNGNLPLGGRWFRGQNNDPEICRNRSIANTPATYNIIYGIGDLICDVGTISWKRRTQRRVCFTRGRSACDTRQPIEARN